jgi:hypothetical protein
VDSFIPGERATGTHLIGGWMDLQAKILIVKFSVILLSLLFFDRYTLYPFHKMQVDINSICESTL